MSRWFVGSSSTQHVRPVEQQLRQPHARPLAAAEQADGFLDVVAAEEHQRQHVADLLLAFLLAALADFLEDGVVRVEFVEPLVVVADVEVRAPARPRRRRRRPRPSSTSSSVVLPEPLGPMMPIRSPRFTSNLMSVQRPAASRWALVRGTTCSARAPRAPGRPPAGRCRIFRWIFFCVSTCWIIWSLMSSRLSRFSRPFASFDRCPAPKRRMNSFCFSMSACCSSYCALLRQLLQLALLRRTRSSCPVALELRLRAARRCASRGGRAGTGRG